jgi:hypothetical protein
LVLGDDELETVAVVGARDRMLEDTDSANDLALLEDLGLLLLCLGIDKVTRVTDDHIGASDLVPAPDARELALVIVHDLVDGLVEHVRPSIDGRETGETLGELSEAVEGVDVGRLAVASDRRAVEDDAFVRLASWPGQIASGVVSLQRRW